MAFMAGLSNDTRGWIMCAASAVACVAGASIICVDALVRLNPRWKAFNIRDSDKFLSACFSTSFGVMLLSAFLDMWPSSIKELQEGHVSSQTASFITIGCFALGYIAIQAFSRWLHSYMPSHVVDCDHSHEDSVSRKASRAHSHAGQLHDHKHPSQTSGSASEATPLLSESRGRRRSTSAQTSEPRGLPTLEQEQPTSISRRPSMMQVPGRMLSFMKDGPPVCGVEGPCKGYTDPCGQECFRTLEFRAARSRKPTSLHRTATGTTLTHQHTGVVPIQPIVPEEGSEASLGCRSHSDSHEQDSETECTEETDIEAQHHHHVPQNAFMNVGLQTSLAIGLHKLPEGFIMFATNHANPELGFNVFFALFIHNITEGFAMALPLYLAFNSRWKAMGYSLILGGLSQPLGAGLAAVWFAIAGTTDHTPGHVVYGCLFGAVSGIMAAVAIMLLLEGVAINHSQPWCGFWVLFGFLLFGLSTALRA